jgi:hypothetical protein
VRVAFGCGEPRESLEMPRGCAEPVTKGLTKRDIAIDVIGQHQTTSGHGWAISESRPKSTLA